MKLFNKPKSMHGIHPLPKVGDQVFEQDFESIPPLEGVDHYMIGYVTLSPVRRRVLYHN